MRLNRYNVFINDEHAYDMVIADHMKADMLEDADTVEEGLRDELDYIGQQIGFDLSEEDIDIIFDEAYEGEPNENQSRGEVSCFVLQDMPS